MTPQEQELMALREELDALKREWNTAKRNLLEISLYKPGTLRFGHNIMELGKEGMQVKASDATVGISFVESLVPDPADVDRFVLQGQVASGVTIGSIIAETSNVDEEAEVRIYADANESRVHLEAFRDTGASASVVVTGDDTGDAHIVLTGVLGLDALASDHQSLADADGRMQYRTDTDKFRGRVNGATDNFAMESWVTANFADLPRDAVIVYTIDGGGATITTGIKGDLEIPVAMTITGWTLLADQSGSIVIDIWKDTYANYPPTVADTITASDKPTISTATKGQDLAPTGWTTAITAGDTLRFNVDSVTSIQRAVLVIRVTVP